MSAPLRIGLVTPAWPGSNTPNGIATAVAHLAAGLEAVGHEVTIIAFAIDAPHDFPRVVELPDAAWSLLERVQMRFGLRTDELVSRQMGWRIANAAGQAIDRYGIEMLVMEETQGWMGIVSRAISIPVVATLHGPWWLHRRFQNTAETIGGGRRELREAAGLREAAAITAPSRDVLERTREQWGLPDVPVAIVGNAVPIEDENESFDADRLDRILFVGRFELVKGGDLIIQAFERLARMHPSCRLTFAGPDVGLHDAQGQRVTLAQTLARLPTEVRARIDALGPQSRERIAQLRKTHGIAVVASRYENFGGTMVEAMAAGSALVCTRVGGCAEILSDGETALVVPPEDPQAIADACLKLLQAPDLARRLGAAARIYVREHLSPEKIGRQMADFLRQLRRDP